MTRTTDAADVRATPPEEARDLLDAGALALLAELHREFEPRRRELLRRRAERRAEVAAGANPGFPSETQAVRDGDWRVPEAPADLRERRAEITGPVERKMMINALNSGASVFMADFEDALTPSWENLCRGQVNLTDAIEGTIAFTSPDGREYRLGERTATLVVRPRGWHLPERHVLVDGEPMSGALFDAGLYLLRNAHRLLERGSGPYFYLAKLENRHEAALWSDVFRFVQDRLGLPHGTVRATVLIETILAAFEMDEILHALGEHATGLNAGRWDYIFSAIKVFRDREDFPVLPERNQVTMTVPFMRAYTELLVRTCHRRGAHAIGGMAAFIPNRRDPELTATALEKVRADKEREAGDGFDGSWCAHPDTVPTVREVFDAALGDAPNQLERTRDDVPLDAAPLLDFSVPGGTITAAGLSNNVAVGIRYLASWLRGNGAAAIFNLMEDAATAEISRSQIWQWVQRGVVLEEGETVTAELVRSVADEEMERLRDEAGGDDALRAARFPEARELFEQVALGDEFVEFLTLPAYERLG